MELLAHGSQHVLNAVSGLASRAEDTLINDWLTGWTPARIPDLRGKTALVTGGNSGLGFETCRKLAENGAKVYLVSRDAKKGHAATARIRAEVDKSAQVEVLQCDLSSLSNVLQLAREFRASNDPLHILVNMAGVFYPGPFALTEDGIEQSLAINYYSHALLALALLPVMAPGGRVVQMSSEGEELGKLDWGNLRGDKFSGSDARAYGAAKLYAIMFARELATRLKGEGRHIDVFAVQPGIVATPGHNKMDRSTYLGAWFVSTMGKLLGQTPYHGAFSTLYAATDPALTGRGYAYIGPNKAGLYHTAERQPSPPARNPVSCWKLFEDTVVILEQAVGTAAMPHVPRHPNDVHHDGRIAHLSKPQAKMA